jgi:hypothetical protein
MVSLSNLNNTDVEEAVIKKTVIEMPEKHLSFTDSSKLVTFLLPG